MELSFTLRTQDYEVWRPDRLWNRPMELPEEDKSFHLCARHRVMKLKRSDFFGWPKDKELPPDTLFGLLAQVLERREDCVMCRLIADSVSHTRHANFAEVIGCWIRDGILEGQETTSLRLRIIPEMVGPEDAFAPFDIVPLGTAGVVAQPFSGRTVNPDQIDLDLVQSWVSNCNNWHGVECAGSTRGVERISVFDPFIRLLDLDEDRLVELRNPEPYVALSYVWGTDRVFLTIGDNIEELKRPVGLSQYHGMFPKSIQDAMTLTKTLGYRHLWVDSICIIQDSSSDKMTQLAAMDRVYTQAALTIVAAGGDNANAGLPGLSPSSRKLTQARAGYSSDLQLVALQLDCQVAVETTRWNQRGWTYQERLLSRRYLFFLNNTVYFQCAKAVWSEDHFAEHKDLRQTAAMMDIRLSRSWQPPVMIKRTKYRLDLQEPSVSPAQDHLRDVLFPTYCQLITEYTVRSMSYPSDRLNGITGILSVLDRDGYMDYLHGLPKPVMEAAILWQPQRDLTRVPVDPITEKFQWPSWSWAGWIGGVVYDAEHDYNGHEPLSSGSLRTRSITKMRGCYLNEFDFIDDFVDTRLRMYRTPTAPTYGLHIRTKTSMFRLIPEDHSGQPNLHPSLNRFGISHVPPVPAHKDTDKYPGESWLGSVRLPMSYQQNFSNEFEFIVLSEAYVFSSEELLWSDSRDNEPFSLFNVMLIRRIYQRGYWSIQEGNGAMVPQDGCTVERIGVGRMKKEAWSNVEEVKDFILV
ncbi:hypothetical protein LQW54_007845 [Pestalotiopsis sp. IQ-011]